MGFPGLPCGTRCRRGPRWGAVGPGGSELTYGPEVITYVQGGMGGQEAPPHVRRGLSSLWWAPAQDTQINLEQPLLSSCWSPRGELTSEYTC